MSFVLYMPATGRQFSLSVGREMSLGREEQNDIVLPHPSVSRQHARCWSDGTTVSVRDLGSRNGTSVDGQPVGPGYVPIPPGGVLRLGDVDLRLATVPEATTSVVGPTPAGKAPEGRTGRIIAIVVAATAVVGAIVGLLTYLQNRPSSIDAYRAQVATVCKSAAARQVQVATAIRANGYDRAVYIQVIGPLADTDAALANDLEELNPPDEVAQKHDETIRAVEKAVVVERDYIRSLPGLPDAEFTKRFPELPGDTQALTAAAQQVRASLVALSGGQCQVGNPSS